MSDWKQRVEEALAEIRAGKMVILVDDEDRENEGDLCMAAELATPEAVNFMAVHARGLICLTMTDEQLDRLSIPMMVQDNTSRLGTAFTVSIEAAEGVSTGISAADRATTILAAVADDATPDDLVRPGHIFPLRARPGGVLVRTGQTEGSVDLARLAGLKSAGVICEIMNPDGTMARMPQLEEFGAEHDLRIVSVADLIRYRLERDSLVQVVRDAPILLSENREWRAVVYENVVDAYQHLALVKGEVAGDREVLVRVHNACVLGDVFGNVTCDCGQRLNGSLDLIEEAGAGVVLYLHRDLRPLPWMVDHHGLAAPGTASPPLASDEVGMPPTLRDFGIGAQILRDLGLSRIRVVTNNPKKIKGLRGYGLDVVERVPIPIRRTEAHIRFLESCRGDNFVGAGAGEE